MSVSLMQLEVANSSNDDVSWRPVSCCSLASARRYPLAILVKHRLGALFRSERGRASLGARGPRLLIGRPSRVLTRAWQSCSDSRPAAKCRKVEQAKRGTADAEGGAEVRKCGGKLVILARAGASSVWVTKFGQDLRSFFLFSISILTVFTTTASSPTRASTASVPRTVELEISHPPHSLTQTLPIEASLSPHQPNSHSHSIKHIQDAVHPSGCHPRTLPTPLR